MNIALCGFYGKNNFGDDLMCDLLSNILSDKIHDVHVYSDTKNNQAINGIVTRGYLEDDIIIVGGGGIVSPSFWLFKDGGLDLLINNQKTVYFINVNITDELIQNANFLSKIKSLKSKWWVRDRYSVYSLQQNGINSSYLPDISTTYLKDHLKSNSEQTLSIFLNSYVFNNLQSENTYNFLDAHCKIKTIAAFLDWMSYFGWKVTFYPCQINDEIDDRIPSAICYSLMKYKGSSHWITSPLSWRELYDSIARSNLIISMRYHPTIIALTQGVPTVDITHHAKNHNLITDLGLESLSVNYNELNQETLIDKTQFAESKQYIDKISAFNKESTLLWLDFIEEWHKVLDLRRK